MSVGARYLFLLAALSLHASSIAQTDGEVRETLLRRLEQPSRNVLKKIGGKAFSCVGKSVIKIYARQHYQCLATRKLPWCDAPGPQRTYCPVVCSKGAWVNDTTREEFEREIVTDCNPIEDPFGKPTKRAQ